MRDIIMPKSKSTELLPNRCVYEKRMCFSFR